MKDKLPKSEFSPDPLPYEAPEPLAPPSVTRRSVTTDQYFPPTEERRIS
ncbi:hypothetical protein ABIB56_001860 [Glaciihabitans sp. UYNi722]